MKKIIVAIDGFSSCGKSTLAKALSKVLHYGYVDTGAMYRAVTLYFLDNNIDFINNKDAVKEALSNIEIHFERIGGSNHIFLNGKDVEADIRDMRISSQVSPVATISEVRRAMVHQQKAMGKRKGIVMDGRDIGTIVFPDAELKIFLVADINVRTQRRLDELIAKGIVTDFESIQTNLLERDFIDSSRADSPLKQADDAILLDNTLLTEKGLLEKAIELVESKKLTHSNV